MQHVNILVAWCRIHGSGSSCVYGLEIGFRAYPCKGFDTQVAGLHRHTHAHRRYATVC
jgi:hypothetical protein